jgi:CMP-N-acetylneuraminic acid synthetase
MGDVVNVFLPMRAGSERISNKNTKSFSGIDGGLCLIKLKQLLQCKLINSIIVSTDDIKVMDICSGFVSDRIKVILRPSTLASSETSTDELIKYVPEIMPNGHILWTHVTSPFIDANVYDRLIQTYFKNFGAYDSLMTVTKLKKFLWSNSGPINYDPSVEKWPRTQTIKPLWEVNSGAFLAEKRTYETHMDRIGSNPFMFELNQEISFDIDLPTDFLIAEAVFQARYLEKTKDPLTI